MKKCILPVILLALLSGCGKVSDASGVESRINIVSGIVEGTTRSRTTSETEAMTDGHTTGSTTSKTAGEKVSGTTTTKSKKSSVQAATRASGGNSGGSRGTTRHVPTVQRTTTTAAQPTSQTPTIDPKDYSSITFELNSSSNEIDVSREGMSGSIQVLKDVDLTEIRNTIANDPSKTINDFIVRQNDFDFDGYPDLFIIEKQDELNKTGKYYRYDPTKGIYTAWSELNNQRFEAMVNSAENSLTFYNKKDTLNYEEKTFEWGENGVLIIRRYRNQYNDGELIETVLYNENGIESLRETRDSQGNLVGSETEEPSAEDLS
ncbi:hypothetical protein [Ruminococcus flavefaciens]|uniref:hypothetical protein n=1 Tax=Ruminococcus flavefaciens TaxID=1265 RepID=UPI0015677CF6|nr:hypothetical protein [Ruminococcus flavefaciens]